MIYIVFPVHNRLDSTKKFLGSLKKQETMQYQVVMCDDKSTDGTSEYIRSEWPNIVLIEGNGSLWWTAGINRCVRYVLERCRDTDYILTINNDVIIPPEYLSQKIQRSQEHPNAIIGSVCLYMDKRNLIETSGFIMDFRKCLSRSITKRGEELSYEHRGVVDVTHLPGKGVLVPVNVYQKIGIYDEHALPHYHADTDFTLRAHKAGYRVLVDFDSKVYSDVNLKNMTIPSEQMTLRNILNTFKGPYSPNNYKILRSFAKNHFPGHEMCYLVRKYINIIGGMLKRYMYFKLNGKSCNKQGLS